MTCDRCTAPSIYSPCGPCQIVAASADLYRVQKAKPVIPDRKPTKCADSPLWERDVIPDRDDAWFDVWDPVGNEACSQK